MKSIRDNDTIQLETLSFCPKNCSNCTRFCSHYKKPWYMTYEAFQQAVDSMVGFKGNQGVGMMGGEPVYHPEFEKFSRYMAEKLGPENCGIWTCLPEFSPEKMAHYGEVISECFGTIFVNDHTRPDIIHAPFLVAIDEIIKAPCDMYYLIDHCWAQRSWSASINPNGAFFCEMAASLSMLFDIKETAWPVEKEWWARTPKDYAAQIERFCPMCGGAVPLLGRNSVETIDDISPGNLERLKAIGSPKIARGEYEVHDLQMCVEQRKMAAYKDEGYRQTIARRYGLFLTINQKGFMVPFKKIVGTL